MHDASVRHAAVMGQYTSRGRVALRHAMAALAIAAVAATADEVLRLCDFETDADLKAWEFRSGTPRLTTEGKTHGDHALELVLDPKGEYHPGYMYWLKVPRDWSAYDALVLDVLNPTGAPVEGYVLVADQAWAEKGRTYWNRHNGSTSFAPGRTEWTIPVRGLFRGEAGSRNNDLKRNLDPDAIVRLDLGFGQKGASGRVIVDDLRLVRAARPEGIQAFDFGPPSQSVMLGWTPVSHETLYTPERGFGWGPTGGAPWNGADRDTTFGTMLLQDFCEAGGYNFHVDVPPGSYRITVFYENCGYWGGEQAMQAERRILVNGKLAWRESRPDGSAHALYRFENTEPVGVDLWDTYMAPELARPASFDAEANAKGLTLRFEADRTWGSKLAALALYRTDDQEAAQWLDGQLQKLVTEFRSKAVCLDPPATAGKLPPAWSERGLVAWPVSLDAELRPGSPPPPAAAPPEQLSLARTAVRGEFEPFGVAVRPTTDLGECQLRLDGFTGPAGKASATVQVAWYGTSRDFNTIAYRVRLHTLREQSALPLRAGVTRLLVVTARTDLETPAGEYLATLVVADAKGTPRLTVPLRLTVRPVTLERSTEFAMGFFGLLPPELLPAGARSWEVLEQTLQLLRDHGMNAVSGGPNWQLKGWRDREPEVDFGDMDRFVQLLRKYGFTKHLNGYGGARFLGLHDGYQKGARAAVVERESGMPYAAALQRAWQVVDEHARTNHWPTILYAMCDETRVRDVAEREIEFMRLMGEVSRAFPQTVRTSGSYSVDFRSRCLNPDELRYWHQQFFGVLDISSLNGHDESVLAEARRLGKDIHIYNQGTSRYSFGLYQWSEFRKGVRARWQWHLNVLHGYQFFDLDGREPDTAMLCYGRNAIYPTIEFERCREGAEDFYLYQTLASAVEAQRRQGRESPAVTAAAQLLTELETRVKLNQRAPPADFDPEPTKLSVIAALEALATP